MAQYSHRTNKVRGSDAQVQNLKLRGYNQRLTASVRWIGQRNGPLMPLEQRSPCPHFLRPTSDFLSPELRCLDSLMPLTQWSFVTHSTLIQYLSKIPISGSIFKGIHTNSFRFISNRPINYPFPGSTDEKIKARKIATEPPSIPTQTGVHGVQFKHASVSTLTQTIKTYYKHQISRIST